MSRPGEAERAMLNEAIDTHHYFYWIVPVILH